MHNTFSSLVLWAYIPLVLGLFAFMKNRRWAVLISFLVAFEFLPMAEIKLPLLLLSKVSACSAGVLLGACLFDFKTVTSFRPRLYDIPILLWCFSPLVTSTQNEIGGGGGWYDGSSATATQIMLWGVPYFIGRVYFADFEGLRELCIAIFLGALIYIPFCAYEIKMSPLLHKNIYGWFQHDIAMTKRGFGFRPMVFMQSGIALGMWMCMAAMIGVWMTINGTVKQILGIPMAALATVLLIAAMACNALTGLLLMVIGTATLLWIRIPGLPGFLRSLPLLILIIAGPFYMYIRASGTWDEMDLVELVRHSVGDERADSLKTRVDAENSLTKKAMDPKPFDEVSIAHDPLFGFGKWSDKAPSGSPAPWRIYHAIEKADPDTQQTYVFWKDDAPTDGMWIITLGTFGLFGLVSLTVSILLPPLLALKRIPMALWSHPLAAPTTALTVMLVLHMLDNLLNAMENPVFILAIGGISALGTSGVKRPVQAVVPLFTPPPEVEHGFSIKPARAIPAGFPNIAGLRVPSINDDFSGSAWPEPIESASQQRSSGTPQTTR